MMMHVAQKLDLHCGQSSGIWMSRSLIVSGIAKHMQGCIARIRSMVGMKSEEGGGGGGE